MKQGKQPRILIAYPGHGFSTIDVADGYRAALERLGYTVDHFGYHEIISFYSVAESAYKEKRPSFSPPQNFPLVMASERLAIQVLDFVPDLVLVVCGTALHPRAGELLRKLGIPVGLLLTESPYLDELQSNMIRGLGPAVVFTNDRSSVEPLQAETAAPVHYLPHSHNETIHHPRFRSEKWKTDIFFQGTLWPERARLFGPLIQENDRYDLKIGGVSPSSAGNISETDIIKNDLLPYYYSNAAINLNHHRTIQSGTETGENEQHINPGSAWSIGPRAYEIAACGGFQLCDDTRPELTAVFGESVPTYSDGENLIELIDHYMARPDDRAELAEMALIAVSGCTFEQRARDIMIPALEKVL